MSLILVGINHNSASIELREKLAIGERELAEALAALCRHDDILEGAIVSTCNRTEVYAVTAPDTRDEETFLADFLAGWHNLSRHAFAGHLYTYRDSAVAAHLFSVAAGIDSMILGEPDIQRQVKQSLEAAQSARAVGTLLNRLFQDALVAGKRARTETMIARGAFSVGAAAVELAKQIFDTLSGHTVLVLGAGKMSEVTAKHLQSQGAPAVLVANRTYDRAVQLAEQFGGEARRFDDLHESLLVSDIVICSTAAPHPVVTRPLIERAMKARRNRPLYIIDIAVPRDVEESVDKLDNVYLSNIDDLQHLVASARQARVAEVERARAIIEEAVTDYLRWWRSLEASPLIVAVRDKLAAVRHAELAKLRSRLPGLSDKEWRTIEASMEAVTNKIAHPATVAIKSAATSTDSAAAFETVRRTFGIDDDEGAGVNGSTVSRNQNQDAAGNTGANKTSLSEVRSRAAQKPVREAAG